MRSWNAFLLASALGVLAAANAQARLAAAPPSASEPLAAELETSPAPAPVAAAPVARPTSDDSGPADAAELFAAFATMEGMEARFVEEKHLALLAAPLVSRGRIYFLRPGHLARVVEEPSPSTLVITPRELRMEGRDGVETIDLRRSDDVRVFVTSLVRVFSGDREGLEPTYDIAFEKSASAASDGDHAAPGWTLTLTPRREPVTRMMEQLRLHGSGFTVHEIVLTEPGGDRTVTRIEAADFERRFTDSEKSSLFGID